MSRRAVPRHDRSIAAGTVPVGTPIGNLEDITLRALRVLRGVDRVLCEDTRRPRICWRTTRSMRRCRAAMSTRSRCARPMLGAHSRGRTAGDGDGCGPAGDLRSGARVAAAVAAAGLPVVPVPGANAALTALVASGLTAERFLFCGFLPSKAGARRTELERLQAMVVAGGEPLTLVFYEAPHRILEMLEDVASVWGAECGVVLARELTKLHEEFLRGGVVMCARNWQSASGCEARWWCWWRLGHLLPESDGNRSSR